MKVRSHLLLFAVGVIVPVAAFSVFVSALLVDRERDTVARGALERARAMMTAVDAEVRGHVTTLDALATSRALGRHDYRTFHLEALRVLSSQPDWLSVVLLDPEGRELINTAAPFGARLPRTRDASLEQTVRTLKPSASDLVTEPVVRKPGINVRVAVVHAGSAAYVLSAYLRPGVFQPLIEQQQLSKDWASGLTDGRGRFIARVPPRAPGELSSAGFRAAVARTREGWYRGLTVEGRDTYTAHVTSAFTGWSIGLAIPAGVVQLPAQRTAWTMTAGVATAAALAFFLAAWLGRRIARPVVSVAEAARALARGESPVAASAGGVEEIRDVEKALAEAAVAVRDRQALLEREKRVLQEADRAKDEFVAMMSHELRNPVGALMSASHLLGIVAPDDPAAVHARGVVARQTQHMAHLIEDLLDISRIVTGKMTLHLESFNLADAVTSWVASWRASGRFQEHPVSLAAAPVWISADRTRIEQIISNLLDNALKFSAAGQEVTIRVGERDGMAVLEVADQGVGLPPQLLERAFDVFVQGEQGLARTRGGMGLGLALVKRLSELQGGQVSAASEGIGKGAVFTVRFRKVQPARAAAPDVSGQARPRRILIIEDNEDMRRTLATSLSLRGHEVQQAEDGRSGLSSAVQGDPSVVIVDIGLPDIDGFEVARRLREAAGGRRRLLIALTGYGQVEDVRRAHEAGFDRHVTKPVSPDRLHQLITSV